MKNKSEISILPNKEQYNLGAYNTRDVQGLPPGRTRWSPELEQIQVAHNRILQEGFMRRDASDVLNDTLTAGAAWLTDVTCPSTSAAIMLHIAKEMVVKYQVADKDLNFAAQNAHELLATPEVFESIDNEVKKLFQARLALDDTNKDKINIEKTARTMLIENLRLASKITPEELEQTKQAILRDLNLPPAELEEAQKDNDFQNKIAQEATDMLYDQMITPKQLHAAMRLAEDMAYRKIQDEVVSKQVSEQLHTNANTLDLKEKTLHKKGTTHDFAFFGAAGSGKSTISKEYLSDEETGPEPDKIDRRDCVTLATDNYRAFTMPGTDEHENKDTKDVYTRSQDFAYMVKEYVGKELERLSASGQRPNLICDCVRLESPMDALLAESPNLVSKVAAYRGSPGFVGIAERADFRAKDKTAAPADKGRFVHTTELLKGHVDASKFLLGNIPPNSETEILDTDIIKDVEKPRRIAIIDSKKNLVEITNLRVMSEFMNKQSINAAAEHPVELILKGKESRDATLAEMEIGPEGDPIPRKIIIPSEMRTNPKNKANAVLSLVTPDYSVILKDETGKAYAEFKCRTKLETRAGKEVRVKDGVYLNVLDIKVYESKLSPVPSPEDRQDMSKLKRPPKNEDYTVLTSPEAQVLAEMTRIAVQPTKTADLEKRQTEALVEYKKKEAERNALIEQMEAQGLKPDIPEIRRTPESLLMVQTHQARRMMLKVESIERLQADKILESDIKTRTSVRQSRKEQELREEQRQLNDVGELPGDHELTKILTTRIISKAIDSPKIITGNYSAILNCFNEILTNTVTVAPDEKNPDKSPVFLIVEPMWLEHVDPVYNSEPWGQGIDAFPPAVRKFAIENVIPTPVMGEKLTWGQVRDLRAKMIERLEKAEGFTVMKGEIANVEEFTPPESHGIKIVEDFKPTKEPTKTLIINFKSRNPSTEPSTVSIPFTGRPVVLDLSQRVGLVPPASSAMAVDPTVLYRDSPARVEETKKVPIFIAGPGAQAAWLMDKMGSERSYTLIYRNTIDFRMANAILNEQRYGPDKMLIPVDPKTGDQDLIAALKKLSTGGKIHYTKDDGKIIDINLTVYQSDDKSKKIFPVDDLRMLNPRQIKKYLRALGVDKGVVNDVITSFTDQMEQLSAQKVDMKRVAVKLDVGGNPAKIDVGYTANCTGWRSLNDFAPKDDAPFLRNPQAKDVPIFIAGPGDQANLLIDKMGTDRPYTLIYRKTIDFRMANAILGEQRYNADTMLVSVDPMNEKADQDLIEALDRLSKEGITKITYTKDNGQQIDLNITFEQADNQNKKILPVKDNLELDPEQTEKFRDVLDSYEKQKQQLSALKVDMDRVVFKLNDKEPVSIEVGYVANCTADQALNDPDFKEKPPFWGTAATVITGEQLTQKIKLVSTAAIPPASGIHRMLAMKSQLQEMKGETPSYDIRALAFTEEQFKTMCKECGFSEGFKKALAEDIKVLINPNAAGNPVEWIAGKHEEWLKLNQKELNVAPNVPGVEPVEEEVRIRTAIKSAVDKTTNILQENVDKNNSAEAGMKMQ